MSRKATVFASAVTVVALLMILYAVSASETEVPPASAVGTEQISTVVDPAAQSTATRRATVVEEDDGSTPVEDSGSERSPTDPIAIAELPEEMSARVRYLLKRALDSRSSRGIPRPTTTPTITRANAAAVLRLEEDWLRERNVASDMYRNHLKSLRLTLPGEYHGVIDPDVELRDLWTQRFGEESLKTAHSWLGELPDGTRAWVYVPVGVDAELDELNSWVREFGRAVHEELYDKVVDYFVWE